MAKDHEYIDDYAVGEKFVSPARTVTEADVINFAGITGDWHPLHTDVEYAASTPFKGRITHGMLTLSLGLSLPFRLGPYASYLPKSFIAFYGMDEVRFTGPNKIGDTIHTEVEVVNITDKGTDKGILTIQNIVKNQRGEQILSFVMRLLCGKRPA